MTRGRSYGSGRLWKRGETWILDYRGADGKRHREQLGRSRREAERLQVEMIAERNRQLRGLSTGDQDMPLARLAEEYLADLRLRVSEMHHRNVQLQLGKLLPALGVETVRQLQPLHVIRYRTALMEGGAANRTGNVHLQALQGMLRWGVRMALIASNPIAGVGRLPDGLKHQRYRRRALSEAEIERLLAAAQAEDETLTAVRWVPQEPLWRCFLETGGRYSEVVRSTWADFDEREGTLTFRAEHTKSGQTRVIPLLPGLRDRLVRLRSEHALLLKRAPKPADRIFLTPRAAAWPRPSNNINRTLARLLEAAGIEKFDDQGRKIDLHSLRHSFISRLARAGVGLIHAQQLAGHSTPTMTSKVYSHLRLLDLRRSIVLLSGIAGVPGERQT